MEDADVDQYFALVEEDKLSEAEHFADDLRSADPSDSIPVASSFQRNLR
ncbi:hypothetical protein AB0P16_11860 [Dietzia maris]